MKRAFPSIKFCCSPISVSVEKIICPMRRLSCCLLGSVLAPLIMYFCPSCALYSSKIHSSLYIYIYMSHHWPGHSVYSPQSAWPFFCSNYTKTEIFCSIFVAICGCVQAALYVLPVSRILTHDILKDQKSRRDGSQLRCSIKIKQKYAVVCSTNFNICFRVNTTSQRQLLFVLTSSSLLWLVTGLLLLLLLTEKGLWVFAF